MDVKSLTGHNHSPSTHFEVGVVSFESCFSAVFNIDTSGIHSTVLNWTDRPERKTTWQRSGGMNGYRKRTGGILIFQLLDPIHLK